MREGGRKEGKGKKYKEEKKEVYMDIVRRTREGSVGWFMD